MKNNILWLALLAGLFLLPWSVPAQTPTDKQLQSIEKYMAPLRKKVTDILDADKTGQYKTYKSDLDVVAKEMDRARRNELLDKLQRDHYEFIKKSYSRAVVNHEEMKREITRILGHSNFALGEFGDLQIDFTPPGLALPERFDVELACPLEVEDNYESSQVASVCVAQAGNCSNGVQCMAEIAGGCRGKTSLGNNFVLPEGNFTNITVATQTDISYEGWAFAVAGYAQVNAKYGIRFRAPGMDKVVLKKELFALAPIIWYAHLVGNSDNFVSQASFTGTFSGGSTVTAQAYLEGFALSVPAFTFTLLYADTDNIDFIRITGTN